MKKPTATPSTTKNADVAGKMNSSNAVFQYLPFNNFDELQRAFAAKQYSFGVNPLAAAEWSEQQNSQLNRALISGLSILLVVAAIASIGVAVAIKNYWLLLALPIQVLAFYAAHLDAPYRTWVTLGGVASLIVFLDFLFNDRPTAATLTAYVGLTFAAVRASTLITNSAYRKALATNDQLFVEAFTNCACTVRHNKSKEVFAYKECR
ncbi:MAG: hypothetical protein HY231_23220 [Acidobacteria bacterium]|nr:hypothetical protein [Acidobacteriota bacterium]